MSSLAYLCLLLSAFTALVSAKPISSPGKNTVYNNCSGDYTHSVPNDVGTGYYAAQVHVKPEDVFKNGTGWEEWLFMAHNPLPDGSEVIYGYKWVWGDPTSGNFSHKAFIGFAYFSNGTYFRQIDRGTSDYQEHPDGGFTVSVVDNHISWDPKQAQWHISVNSGGFVVDEYIERSVSLALCTFCLFVTHLELLLVASHPLFLTNQTIRARVDRSPRVSTAGWTSLVPILREK